MPTDQPAARPPVWVFDGIVAGVLFLFVWAAGSGSPTGAVLSFVLAVGYCAPLAWRRTAPDLAALAIIPAHLVQLFALHAPHAGNASVPVMMYAVAAYGRERLARPWLWFGLAASAMAALSWTYGGQGTNHVVSVAVTTGGCAALVAAAWFMGSLKRARIARNQALVDRAEALRREQVQSVLLAATEERQRIAREMHDIVAHSLSVIVVQADGARYVATDAPGTDADRLARAAQAIDTIATTARSALAETRRLVGVLHSDDAADLAPAASLADVESLVSNLTAAGRLVTLSVTGNAASYPPLGSVGELAAYRVVQEALTNVLKHAGPGATASVSIQHRPEGVSVGVADDGRGAGASDGAGHGLIGMRQRLQAVGGTLATFNRPGGGFQVQAFIPRTRNEDAS